MNAGWPSLAVALFATAPTEGFAQAAPPSPAPAVPADPAPVQQGPETPDGPDPMPPGAAPPAAPPPRAEPPPTTTPLPESPLVHPRIDVSVPEPPAPVQRKAKNHDGFYLRSSLGLATGTAFIATDSSTHPNYTLGGGGLALDLLIGGTPTPGLALGGGLMLRTVTDDDVELDGPGRAGSGTGGLVLLGAFVDGFPMANGGLHFGGLVGLARGAVRRQDETDEFEGGGLGMAAWVGHGFWVGREWSIGGLLKLDAALMRDDSGPVVLANTTYGLALLFTVLYH